MKTRMSGTRTRCNGSEHQRQSARAAQHRLTAARHRAGSHLDVLMSTKEAVLIALNARMLDIYVSAARPVSVRERESAKPWEAAGQTGLIGPSVSPTDASQRTEMPAAINYLTTALIAVSTASRLIRSACLIGSGTRAEVLQAKVTAIAMLSDMRCPGETKTGDLALAAGEVSRA